MKECKKDLLVLFEGRDRGDVTVFNEVTFKRHSWGLSLNLKHYWGKVFTEVDLQQSPGKKTSIAKKISTADSPSQLVH